MKTLTLNIIPVGQLAWFIYENKVQSEHIETVVYTEQREGTFNRIEPLLKYTVRIKGDVACFKASQIFESKEELLKSL